jgi:hypothetical protein
MMKNVLVKRIGLLSILLLPLLALSCASTTMPTPSPYPLTIQDVPIWVGEQPASAANAIVGTWSTSDLRLTTMGDISGRITLTMSRPASYATYQDVLMVQVWATYVWPQHGDTITQPAGDFIPVVATTSSDTSVVFDLDGAFEVPALALDIDGGMPLIALPVTMIWFRVTDRSEDSYGWYGAKVGAAPQDGQARSAVSRLDTKLSLTGTIDTNVRGDLTYSEWFLSNPQFGAATFPSPLPAP